MNKFMPNAVTVFVKDGTTFVLSPSGDILSKLTGVTLVDNVNETPTVTVTLYCNVVGSELEANQKYKAAKLAKLQAELERQKAEQEEKALEATVKYKIGDAVLFYRNSNANPVAGRIVKYRRLILDAGVKGENAQLESWRYDIKQDDDPDFIFHRKESEIVGLVETTDLA